MIIQEIESGFSEERCERLILLFGADVARSLVGYQNHRVHHQHRTSSSCKIERSSIPADALIELDMLVVLATNLPLSHQERWEIARYRPGEHFSAHLDVAAGIDRAFSLILYLRAPISGGETAFPRLGRSIVPVRGKLLAWKNLDDSGAILDNSLHESRPVIEGEKWVLVTWVRSTPYASIELMKRA